MDRVVDTSRPKVRNRWAFLESVLSDKTVSVMETPDGLRYITTGISFCVIASTRRILTTGTQISYMEEVTELVFNRYLMDLGANVLVVVVLILALYVSRRACIPAMTERADVTQGSHQ